MKAVIVIDMPERCDECPVRHMGLAYCTVGKFSTSHFASGKPVDETHRHPKCPARPLPMKMSPPTYRDYDKYKDAVQYYAGWNDCIDKIDDDEYDKFMDAGIASIDRDGEENE